MSHTERIRAQARRDHGTNWEWDRAPSEVRIWSEWEIETVRLFWREGKTGTHIGNFLGRSRSSVLAKVSRLGLCRSGQ